MAELVLALDVATPEAGDALLARVPGVRWVKVGSVLFTAAGPTMVTSLRTRGYRVFLDLKWHDIPNTVVGAVHQARRLGVDMVTVHTLGGGAMMSAAKDAAGPDLAVVGVTVLTSHDSAGFAAVVGRDSVDLGAEVERLAELARRAGIDGMVSSPLETARLRAILGPDKLLVTPGIRCGADRAGDQVRVATAGAAARAGSTHLVVGRPVLESADPAKVWAALTADIG